MNDGWIDIWNNAVVNYLKGQSRLSVAETEEIHDRLEQNVLGQTAASRCGSSPKFQGLTLSPSSGWRRSQSLKRWRSFIPWRVSLPENILLKSVATKALRLVTWQTYFIVDDNAVQSRHSTCPISLVWHFFSRWCWVRRLIPYQRYRFRFLI